MIELSTIVSPVKFPIILLVLAVLIFVCFAACLSFVVVLNRKDVFVSYHEKKNENRNFAIKQAVFQLATLIALLTLLFFFVVNIQKYTAAIVEYKEIINETVDKNIAYTMKENEQKIMKDEMTLAEIKTHFLVHPEYFKVNSSHNAHNDLEEKIKIYVYKNYDRDNPVYQKIILNSEKIF